jgi:hypothetical protein
MAEKMDIAPPCEKPPRIIRVDGMPEAISEVMREWK